MFPPPHGLLSMYSGYAYHDPRRNRSSFWFFEFSRRSEFRRGKRVLVLLQEFARGIFASLLAGVRY